MNKEKDMIKRIEELKERTQKGYRHAVDSLRFFDEGKSKTTGEPIPNEMFQTLAVSTMSNVAHDFDILIRRIEELEYDLRYKS